MTTTGGRLEIAGVIGVIGVIGAVAGPARGETPSTTPFPAGQDRPYAYC
ncbi:hypothetical protein [Streptomyces rectiverticillatus]|nr:hypothetical protein [Streptomyces rectiverticillatus]